MANLVEIDLDDNVVIQIPQGQKIPLAQAVALTCGWTPTVPNVKNKEHIGEKDYIENLRDKLTESQLFLDLVEITDDKNDDFGKFRLTYLDETPIDNPIGIVQFGLNYLQKVAGDIARNAVKEQQLKTLREQTQQQLQQAEEQVSAGLESSFKNLIIK